ncbi:MAG: hypothetical protein D3906_11785 [Candidatus Electrothrix sp. AUS1_2]|nr:hypothetical protein [Candidatus Electrothrix sp. AUS1_2]
MPDKTERPTRSAAPHFFEQGDTGAKQKNVRILGNILSKYILRIIAALPAVPPDFLPTSPNPLRKKRTPVWHCILLTRALKELYK